MESNCNSQLEFFFVDAPAGFGKTFHAVSWAVERMKSGEKVVIVLKSLELINEQFQRAQKLADELDGQVFRINGDGKKIRSSVKARIKKHLEKSPNDTGEVLFITEAAMLSLRYFPKPENWTVIFDEIPKVETEAKFKSPDNHSIITGKLKASSPFNDYLKITPKDKQARRDVNKIARNPRADDVWRIFMPLADGVATSDFEVYVSEKIWKDYFHPKHMPKSRFLAHVVLHPRKFRNFKKVIIMGAMFKESLLFQVWNHKWNKEIVFAPFVPIQDVIGQAKHDIKAKLTIKYLTDLPWTKNLAKCEVNSQDCLSHAIEKVALEFGDEEFVYSLNKSVDDASLLKSGHRLSGSPHGINKYKHIKKGAFLAAINPKPETCKFYQSLGLSREDIKKAFMFQYCYQALLRTGLRDPNCTGDIVIIVPSKEIADWFKGYFVGDVVVEKLDGFPEEEAARALNSKGISMSNAQRQDKRRRGEWLKEITDLNSLASFNGSSTDINKHFVSNQSNHENVIEIQLFSRRKERPKVENILTCDSWNDLFLALREFSTTRIEKHSNCLISPAIFGDKKINEEKTKRLENVEFCSCIIIDRDDGSLTYKEFMDLFPGLRMCVYNSHKGCGRFRAIIPLSKKVPAAVYTDICRSLRAKVENAGFARGEEDPLKPCHGIDANGFAATSVFYIPCLPASEKPEDSFFIIREGSLLDPEPLVVNPLHSEVETYVARNTKASKALNSCISGVDATIREVKVTQKVAEYTKIKKDETGNSRRAKFMGLGRSLSNFGYSEAEIAEILHEADHDGARARNDDIRKVLQTITKRN